MFLSLLKIHVSSVRLFALVCFLEILPLLLSGKILNDNDNNQQTL
jgi:hypothetical protein